MSTPRGLELEFEWLIKLVWGVWYAIVFLSELKSLPLGKIGLICMRGEECPACLSSVPQTFDLRLCAQGWTHGPHVL
jgi:hypothetical protein